MRFSNDSQRRAMFANLNNFARRPSDKMVREVFESANEPVTDFRQAVFNPDIKKVETIIDEDRNLSNVRTTRHDFIRRESKFPEHGYKFFTAESAGSLSKAKEQAEILAEYISGGDAVGWADPIRRGTEILGYTVRLKNIKTGEEILEQDMSVAEDEFY